MVVELVIGKAPDAWLTLTSTCTTASAPSQVVGMPGKGTVGRAGPPPEKPTASCSIAASPRCRCPRVGQADPRSGLSRDRPDQRETTKHLRNGQLGLQRQTSLPAV